MGQDTGSTMRKSNAVMSANRRNPINLKAARGGLPVARHSSNLQSKMFPPLNDTSFSEQYKTFKALGGKTKPSAMNSLEMSRDL